MKQEKPWPETRLRRLIQERGVPTDSQNVFSWEHALLSFADWKCWLNTTRRRLCRHHRTPAQSSTPNSLVDISQLCLNIRGRQQQFSLLWGCLLCIYTTTSPKVSVRIAWSILVFDSFHPSDRFQHFKPLFISALDEYPEHYCNCTVTTDTISLTLQ